jgi:hypothetical protein
MVDRPEDRSTSLLPCPCVEAGDRIRLTCSVDMYTEHGCKCSQFTASDTRWVASGGADMMHTAAEEAAARLAASTARCRAESMKPCHGDAHHAPGRRWPGGWPGWRRRWGRPRCLRCGPPPGSRTATGTPAAIRFQGSGDTFNAKSWAASAPPSTVPHPWCWRLGSVVWGRPPEPCLGIYVTLDSCRGWALTCSLLYPNLCR